MTALAAYQREGRAVLEHKSKSFSLAALFLPRAAHEATVALYAYCRRCDDAVDTLGQSAGERQRAVTRLQEELASVYAGEPQREPVLAAFQAVVQRYAIPRLYPEELLAGMGMDAQGARYETLPELLLYCYRVAGTVGLMMCHVMGLSDVRALRRAAHLGIAMQLTNICRDVLEDFRMGRLYLPRALLGESFVNVEPGRDEHALFVRGRNAQLRAVVERLLAEADAFYASADLGLAALPWRCALAVRAARLLYAAIGTRLRLSGYDPLRGRAVTPLSWKLALVLRSSAEALLSWPKRALLAPLARRTYALPTVRFPEHVLPL